MRWYIALFVISFIFSACEKELHIKISQGEPKLVVNGRIESGGLPIVLLSKSIGFFETVDPSSIQFVTGASVKVIDVNTNDTMSLRNYVIDSVVNGKNFQFSVYAPDTSNIGGWIFGQFEHTYKLLINAESKTYEAYTKIPAVSIPDSVFLKPKLISNSVDSMYEIYITYDDPDTAGNYLRYFTKRISSDSKYSNSDYITPPQGSVIPDFFASGKKLDWNVQLAYSDSVKFENAEQFFPYVNLLKGDSASVKFCAIDYNTYNFWNTVEFSKGQIGNPFSSPIKIQGNISNNAIGCWCGYGVTYFGIKAPK